MTYKISGAALAIIGLVLLFASSTIGVGSPIPTSPNLKVAFIGDQGLGANPEAVLQLIQDEGAELVIHQGDFDYADDPDAWDNQINTILGPQFPYIASIGNHDVLQWTGYQQKLQARVDAISDLTCTGDLGVQSTCSYKGLFIVLTGPGIMGSGHDTYIQNELAANNSIWSVCSWHKNQILMQTGTKGNETGWGVYEACRLGGGIIASGHEHAYSRTHLIDDFSDTPNIASTSNTLQIEKGKTFVFVSGLGGHSIRNQDRGDPWWASIYTSDQNANFGALFCSFNVDEQPEKASCYFKDISGNVPDSFTVLSAVETIPQNLPPVVDAGIDQTITLPSTVALDGTVSDDALPGAQLSSLWFKESGPGVVTFGDTFAVDTTAAFSIEGLYVLRLVAGDGEQSSLDAVTITINAPIGQPPVANAGPDQTIADADENGVEMVTLDGSGSSDPDGTIVSYEWTEGGSPIGTASSVTQATFTIGVHNVTLMVTDDDGDIDTDTVVITVNANQSPIAAAGSDQTVLVNDLVSLDGTGSSDPDGGIVSYSWDFDAADGIQMDATGITASTSYAIAGTYTVTLTVTDNGGAVDTASIQVTVSFPGAILGWCDTSYSNRKTVTIHESDVDANLTNFPVWVAFDADVTSTLQTDGDDFFFTDENECASDDPTSFTRLDHDFVDADSDVTTGFPGAFVEVGTVSSTASTVLYMYYGNSTATSSERANDTWNSNFKAVYHLEESSGTRNDATSNAVNLTDNNTVTSGTGQLGTAANFVASNSKFLETNTAAVTAIPFSILAWFNPDANNQYNTISMLADKDVTNQYFRLSLRGGDGPPGPVTATIRQSGASWASSAADYSASTWQHGAAVFNSSTVRAAYLDGENKGTNTTNSSPTGMDRTSVGRSGDASPGDYMDGLIDEVWILDIAVSDAFVKFAYRNQSGSFPNPSFGTEELAP